MCVRLKFVGGQRHYVQPPHNELMRLLGQLAKLGYVLVECSIILQLFTAISRSA